MEDLNNLPAEIISDILTCLPAESVLDCKLVSKTWRDIIKHPLFYKMHTNRLINHSAETKAYSTNSGKLGFLGLAKDKHLSYFEYVENNKTPIDKINIKKISLAPQIQYYKYTYVGSCNGLICLRGVGENICIYNPMTKEYVLLPHPMIDLYQFKFRWFGFGYLPLTNEYKVILMYKVPKFVVVMVYTLGSGNGWRNIGEFKLKSNYVFRGNSIFANGALYWMHRKVRTILVFDLADEKFREHLSPPRLPAKSSLELGSLGGYLLCEDKFYHPFTNKYLLSNLWLYKEENDKYEKKHQSLSWTNEFSVVYRMPIVLYIRLLMHLKEQFWQIFPHKNTFVSLKELEEENTKIMESVKIKKRKRHD